MNKLLFFSYLLFLSSFSELSADIYQLNKRDIEVLKKTKNWLNTEYSADFDKNGILRFKYGSLPTVFCKPSYATSIELEPGESVESFKSAKSKQWFLDTYVRKNGSGLETTYVLIRPLLSGLETNLLIFTNKRIYNIRMVSKSSLWTPFVGFVYEDSSIGRKTKKEKGKVSTNKKITEYSMNMKNRWIPTSIKSKNGKTYIKVKDQDTKLFVMNKNKTKKVKYWYKNGYLIVDTIIENAILIKDGFIKKIIKIRRNK